MSGNHEDDAPTVSLIGPAMRALVLAIPEIESRIEKPICLIGGLAVICRLRTTYRATSDLDTVNRRSSDEPAQLEVLLKSGATPADAAGVVLPTSLGPVKVDVLEVADWELEELPDDPTDRLHVLAHAWAAATATSMTIQVESSREALPERVSARVAEPGPLIAMKLQSVMNRPLAKEGTDLLDIVRLTLDRAAGAAARAQFDQADETLRYVAALHARRWFVEQRDRTLRRIRAIPEGTDIDLDTLDLVAELLPKVTA